MNKPYLFYALNDSCYILPRAKIPNGLILNYQTCPENFDNTTLKLVKYCCFIIIYGITQKSNYKNAQDFLRDYSSSLLVIPSVLFNILALIVLNRFNRLKNYSQTSTTFYMKSICFLDTLTIVSKFLHEIIVVRNAVRTNPIVINSYMCKFLFFFESSCSISAIFLLITMSIDKLICVLKPLKAKQILSSFKIIVIVIIFVSTSISSFELFTQTAIELPMRQNPGLESNISINHKFIRYDCDSLWPEHYENWILFNHGIKVFLPIIIICFCNSWIVFELTKKAHGRKNFSTRERDSLKNYYSSSINNSNLSLSNEIKMINKKYDDSNPNNPIDTIEKVENQRNNIILLNGNKKKSSTKNSSVVAIDGLLIVGPKKNNATHISIMLFAVSFGFVIYISFLFTFI